MPTIRLTSLASPERLLRLLDATADCTLDHTIVSRGVAVAVTVKAQGFRLEYPMSGRRSNAVCVGTIVSTPDGSEIVATVRPDLSNLAAILTIAAGLVAWVWWRGEQSVLVAALAGGFLLALGLLFLGFSVSGLRYAEQADAYEGLLRDLAQVLLRPPGA